MNEDEEKFEEIKAEAENLYKTFGTVYCPYLKDTVHFNAQGIEHLKFKRYEKPRSEKDQYMRFKLLSMAPQVIRLSHTLQGLREIKKFERMRKNNRTETVLVSATFYEFIALMKRNRVKIVVKQIENGEKFFWSIIPFWRINKNRTRLFFEGNPDED